MESISSRFERFTAPPNESGCTEWIGARNEPHGYGVIKVDGKLRGAHRVAYEIANSCEIPAGMFILHRCDNPACVNPKHLRLGTHRENVADRDSKNRVRHGETHPSARLSEGDVLEILRRLSTGESAASVAESFHIGQSSVYKISTGATWKRLDKTVKKVHVSAP